VNSRRNNDRTQLLCKGGEIGLSDWAGAGVGAARGLCHDSGPGRLLFTFRLCVVVGPGPESDGRSRESTGSICSGCRHAWQRPRATPTPAPAQSDSPISAALQEKLESDHCSRGELHQYRTEPGGASLRRSRRISERADRGSKGVNLVLLDPATPTPRSPSRSEPAVEARSRFVTDAHPATNISRGGCGGDQAGRQRSVLTTEVFPVPRANCQSGCSAPAARPASRGKPASRKPAESQDPAAAGSDLQLAPVPGTAAVFDKTSPMTGPRSSSRKRRASRRIRAILRVTRGPAGGDRGENSWTFRRTLE